MKAALDPVKALTDAFGDAILDSNEFRGELTITVDASRIVEVGEYIRDTDGLKFNMLSDIAGIDYLPADPEEKRFCLNYHLYSTFTNRRLRLKVLWNEEDAPVPSVTSVWPSANWEEREAYDMFGILFANHPDLRRVLMPPEWDGFPQRKDYPLGYETVQFSFNFDEIQKHKPFAKK